MPSSTTTRSQSRKKSVSQADRAKGDNRTVARANKQQDISLVKQKSDAARAEQEYMERLAQEFSSLPDREISQEGSGSSSAVSQTKSTPRSGSDSKTSTNVAITKTIRSAMSDIRKR
jgi:hypothetical protein